MCNPALLVLSGGVQAAQSYSQGQIANINAQAEADALESQGRMERMNAEDMARQIRRDGTAARGRTVTAAAASGVRVGEGSALDAERRVMEDAAVDEYMAILNGNMRATQLQTEAGNRRRAGRDARRAGAINAFTSLLSTGAQGLKASGWRSAGPGFSGTQAPAPISSGKINWVG